mgnify:CR=1 FL=1
MTTKNDPMENVDKKFFIIKKTKYNYQHDNYEIHDHNVFDLTTAVKKILALDTLNEDRERTSYHLQEVSFSMVDKPLVLTDEVKEDKNWKDQVSEEIPF